MRRLFILALTPFFLSACAPPSSSSFTPRTIEGARCKLDCVDRSSMLFLGVSYERCLEACADLDRLYQARETPSK